MPWMRVDSRGILSPGFTRDSKVATAPAGPNRRAAISTIRSVRRSAPVVSRSTTTSGRSTESPMSAARVSWGRTGSVTPGSWPRSEESGEGRLPGPGRAFRRSGRIPPGETRRVQQRGRISVFAPGVVGGVPEERRAEAKQVDPELVHATRLGDQLDESGLAPVLEHPVARRGRAARRMNDGPAGRRQGLD